MSSSLSCHYITLSSLPNYPSSSSSSSSSSTSKTKIPNPKIPETRQTKRPIRDKQHNITLPQDSTTQQQKQLSIMQIEQAIGAGTFRDGQPRDMEEKKIVYNGILPDFSGIFEGPVEKQLRETGVWLANGTEQGLRSPRKGILMLLIKWILPIWTLSLLVASGVVKLPFTLPFLDDLIM